MVDDAAATRGLVLEGEIGRGAMGIVYRARAPQGIVALKALREPTPRNLLALKREFRTLAEISHPNLVELYELVVEGHTAWFTMELVDGPDLATYVRPGGVLDLEKLTSVLGGVARGLHRLHGAGKRHGDIKPSNLRCTEDGTPKLLDFGLSGDAVGYESGRAVDGTLPYLAPEVFEGGLGRASDVFALGVVAYELVTGRLPFPGPLSSSLLARQRARYARLPADLPPEITEAIVAMLEPSAGARWTAERLVEALEARQSLSEFGPKSWVPREAVERELSAALDAADARMIVFVRGPSGIGKTSLVEHVLTPRRSDETHLFGRCHPNEAVPFRGLDGVVDELAGLAEKRAVALPDSRWLGRAFPVLGRSNAEAGVPRDAVKLAMRELAALMERVVDARPLVLWIDDAQWAPSDTGDALHVLLEALPRGRRVRLIVSYRDEPSFAGFRESLGSPAETTTTSIDVAPLDDTQAHALVAAFDGHVDARRAAAHAVGNPYVLIELARIAAEGHASLDLDVALAQRVDGLDPTSRRAVELVCLAGRPVSRDMLESLAGPSLALTSLRKQRLLRPIGHDAWLPYHDLLRTSVGRRLETDRRRSLHGLLAASLVRSPDPEPDWVLEHLLGADQPEDARPWAARAAERASRALAFSDAVRFYRLALDLPGDAHEMPHLLTGFAEALERTGQVRQAGDAFERAASLLAPGDPHGARVVLQRAADAFIKVGRHERGRELLGEVLAKSGVKLPSPGLGALAMFFWQHLRVRVRGLDFVATPEDAISAGDRLMLEAMLTAAHGLVMTEPTVAQGIGARFLAESLRVGSARHVAAALSGEASFEAALGGTLRSRAEALVARSNELADACGDRRAQAIARVTVGCVAWLEGAFARAVPSFDEARALTLSDPEGSSYTVATADVFWASSLTYLGRLAEVRAVNPGRLEEALAREDLFAANQLRQGHASLAWLAIDRPDLVESMAAQARATFHAKAFTTPRYHYLLSMVAWALYVGRPDEAVSLVESEWPELRRAQYLRLELPALELRDLRARAHLAAAATTGSPSARRSHLAVARSEAASLSKAKLAFGRALACCLEIGLGVLEAKSSGEIGVRLDRATQAVGEADLGVHARALRAYGGGSTDDEGAALARVLLR